MQKINKVISAKLHNLLLFLHHATKAFEKVAKRIDDRNIKMSVREVALETNQYKHELNSQLQSLRIKRIKDSDVVNNGVNTNEMLKNKQSMDITKSDKELVEICCKSEEHFEKAYRNVLNEFFQQEELRNMLVYQLNGLKCAFMQLKLLRAVRWN